MSDMGKMLGFGLLAAGGYYVLEQMGILPCLFNCPVATPVATNTGNPVNSGSSTTTNTTSTQVATQTTLQQVVAKMQAAGDDPTVNHTVWQFNYYYQEVTGNPGPDPTVIVSGSNADTAMIDINTWWAGMSAAGFQGLGGLGVIANRVNPYANPMGRPFGNYAQLLASETAIKRF